LHDGKFLEKTAKVVRNSMVSSKPRREPFLPLFLRKKKGVKYKIMEKEQSGRRRV